MAKRIIVAVIFVPVLIVIMLYPSPILLGALMSLISAVACFELIRATGEGKVTAPMLVTAVISAALIPMSALVNVAKMTVGGCAFVVMAVSFWCAIRAYDEIGAPIRFYHVLVTMFGGVMIPVGLSSLVILKCMDHGEFLVLLAVLLAFITDAGAYFAGVLFGRHRNITRVSPNKSVEGFIGGFLTGIAAALIFGVVVQRWWLPVNPLSLALCGFFGALATEMGDLAFSLIKRQYCVKDYGDLLPGHGGMLDRFDSMIFCAPVVLFIVMVFPVFPA